MKEQLCDAIELFVGKSGDLPERGRSRFVLMQLSVARSVRKSDPELRVDVQEMILDLLQRNPLFASEIPKKVQRTLAGYEHVLQPNLVRSILVFATLGAGFSLLSSSTLSFIGLGAQPPTPEWGGMLSDGRSSLSDAWWIGAFPGLAIFLTVVSVNIVSQWLRDSSHAI